jgi:hypothetical protein
MTTNAIVPSYERPTRIVGKSDRRRLPRLGKIHLGAKVSVPKKRRDGTVVTDERGQPVMVERPTDLDYFRFDAESLERYPQILDLYGEKPTRLDIVFPVDDPHVFFPQAYKLYGRTRGLKCIGNGVTATRFLCSQCHELSCKCEGNRTLDYVPVKCPCEWHEQGICRPVGSLQFMLHKLNGGMSGIWQIDTGSDNSIIDLNSGIDMITGMCKRIAMIPLVLTRRARKCFPPGKPPTIKHTLQLECECSLQEIARIQLARTPGEWLAPHLVQGSSESAERRALGELTGRRALAEPELVPDPEPDAIADPSDEPEEFVPEEMPDDPEAVHDDSQGIPLDEEPMPSRRPADANACADCGAVIDERVRSYSVGRYRRALCYGCQAKEKAKSNR